jgi:hypothetical protein
MMSGQTRTQRRGRGAALRRRPSAPYPSVPERSGSWTMVGGGREGHETRVQATGADGGAKYHPADEGVSSRI